MHTPTAVKLEYIELLAAEGLEVDQLCVPTLDEQVCAQYLLQLVKRSLLGSLGCERLGLLCVGYKH